MVRAPGTNILYQPFLVLEVQLTALFPLSNKAIITSVHVYARTNGLAAMVSCHWQQVSWCYTEKPVWESQCRPYCSSAGKDDLATLGIYKSFAKLISLEVLRFRELIPVAQPHVQSRR
jgi:hypothetical protein